MTPVVDELDSITLHVTDIGQARAFYAEVMGFEEALWNEQSGTAVFFLPGGARLLMHEQQPEEPGRPAGTVTGLMFACEDVEAAVETIRERGGTLTDEPWQAPWGPTYATVADPSGNEFVLIHRERELPSPTG